MCRSARDTVGPETVAAMTLAVAAGERREWTSGRRQCASQRRRSGSRHCRACRRPVRPRQCLCRRRGDRSGADRGARRRRAGAHPSPRRANCRLGRCRCQARRATLPPRPLGEQAEDAVVRGLAGAVIVSGAGTGQPTNPDDLRAVRAALPEHTALRRQRRDGDDASVAARDRRWRDRRHGGEGRRHPGQSGRSGARAGARRGRAGRQRPVKRGERRSANARKPFFVVLRACRAAARRALTARRASSSGRTVTLLPAPA